MAAQAELQALLRFLSQDAKIPLGSAMGKVKDLRGAGLSSADAISRAKLEDIQAVFKDEKVSKQVFNAAKRVSKKRPGADGSPEASTSPNKRRKSSLPSEPLNEKAIEDSLELPPPVMNKEELSKAVIFTNRAPLVLAFAVALLEYTMPEQPLSSRLSLAQAVVSANSRSKAVSLGLEKGKSAEEEGWGQGQPLVKVMGREIRVLRRWGYSHDEPQGESVEGIEQSKISGESSARSVVENNETEPPLWGLDLEALRQSNTMQTPGAPSRTSVNLPIYTAQSARSYLLKSFATAPPTESSESPPKKKTASALTAEKEQNLGLLLGALRLLYTSWAHVLDRKELDRRAWGWYLNVRPEVETGVAGWGGKGNVKLADILNLRRKG